MPEAWVAPEATRLRVRPAPAEYLAPVVADLRSRGFGVDVERLAGPDASRYLAELANLRLEDILAVWRGLFDEAERARQAVARAAAWKRVLRPVLVAARRPRASRPTPFVARPSWSTGCYPPRRTGPMTSLGRSRRSFTRSLILLPTSPAASTTRLLAEPDLAAMRGDLEALLNTHHLERVAQVLRRGARQVVDRVRKDLALVAEQKLQPVPFEGARRPDLGGESTGGSDRDGSVAEDPKRDQAPPADIRPRRASTISRRATAWVSRASRLPSRWSSPRSRSCREASRTP